MKFSINSVDLRSATDADLQPLLLFRKLYHEAVTPDDPYVPDKVFLNNMRVQLEAKDVEFEFLSLQPVDEPAIVVGLYNYGWLTDKHPAYKNNQHMAFAEIQILPEYRHKGLGAQCMQHLADVLRGTDKQMLMANTFEEDGLVFAKKLGMQEALANIENRLYLQNIDWNLMKEWIEKGEQQSPQTKLEFFTRIPDELIESFAKVYTETINQVPRGEMDFGDIEYTPEKLREEEDKYVKMNYTKLTGVTIEPTGMISGLTQLGYNPATKIKLSQGLTSVEENNRGRGLGKWLKAATLLKAKELYPDFEYIVTDNATTNAAMRHINELMGFKQHRMNYNLQIPIEQFLASVVRNS